MEKIWSHGRKVVLKAGAKTEVCTGNTETQPYVTVLPANATKSVSLAVSSLACAQAPGASGIPPIPLPRDNLSAS